MTSLSPGSLYRSTEDELWAIDYVYFLSENKDFYKVWSSIIQIPVNQVVLSVEQMTISGFVLEKVLVGDKVYVLLIEPQYLDLHLEFYM